MSNNQSYLCVGACGQVKSGVHFEDDGCIWEVYNKRGDYFRGKSRNINEAIKSANKYMLYLYCINNIKLNSFIREAEYSDFDECGFRNLYGEYDGE